MSAIQPKLKVDTKVENSCNWRCCLRCGHQNSPKTVVEQPSPSILHVNTIDKVTHVFRYSLDRSPQIHSIRSTVTYIEPKHSHEEKNELH